MLLLLACSPDSPVAIDTLDSFSIHAVQKEGGGLLVILATSQDHPILDLDEATLEGERPTKVAEVPATGSSVDVSEWGTTWDPGTGYSAILTFAAPDRDLDEALLVLAGEAEDIEAVFEEKPFHQDQFEVHVDDTTFPFDGELVITGDLPHDSNFAPQLSLDFSHPSDPYSAYVGLDGSFRGTDEMVFPLDEITAMDLSAYDHPAGAELLTWSTSDYRQGRLRCPDTVSCGYERPYPAGRFE